MRRKSTKFWEKYELRDAVYEAVNSGIKSYAKQQAGDFLADQVSILVKDASAEIVGAFLGNVAGSCLRLALGVQNQVATNLNKLIRAPFETGMRSAQEALTLSQRTDHEIEFRRRRLEFAAEELDRALTLADKDSPESHFISFVQGLCYREIPGALELARSRLRLVADMIESEIPSDVRAYAADKAKREEERRARWSILWRPEELLEQESDPDSGFLSLRSPSWRAERAKFFSKDLALVAFLRSV